MDGINKSYYFLNFSNLVWLKGPKVLYCWPPAQSDLEALSFIIGPIYTVLLYVWIFWLKKIEIFNGSCIICFVFSFLFIYKLSRIMSRFYFFFYEFSGKINKITTFSEIRALNKPSSCLPLKFYPGQKCLSITGKKNIENHFFLFFFCFCIA